MAVALHIDKIEDDGTIRVRHTFYGETLEDCERERDAHAAGCRAFGPAVQADRTIEETEEIEQLPEWEEPEDDAEDR